MNRIKLKVGDILFSELDDEVCAKAEVLFVKEGTSIKISLYDVNTQKIKSLGLYPTIIRCADMYLDPGMGWRILDHVEREPSKTSFFGVKEAVSLSKILYECKAACGILQKEKNTVFQLLKKNFWPFKDGIFCSVLHEKSCLRVGWEEIGYDSLEWKELLAKNKTIHFEEPDYEVYLGCINKVSKGFEYKFFQGIEKTVYIKCDYINWPIVSHYWDYYAGIDRPVFFHRTIPPWSHTV